VKAARLVANPGCYPTSILLPVLPLVEAKLVDTKTISVNALSGISGAGRSAKQEMLFTELDGGVSAYGIGRHRHVAEIEQELAKVSGVQNKISFTPHLVPLSRGMLSTINAKLINGATADSVRAHLQTRYASELFVTVLSEGAPSSHQVRGTNQCFISVHAGRLENELIIVSVIDNLVKGASGQALQNANLMIGVAETTNLELTAIFP
jgi:N-acetyl-gamma-glutamyl-phosphate reductase